MYSKEFIEEVKAVYPNDHKMIKLAEEGGHFLGRYLDDGSQGGFPVDRILLATSLDELQKEARQLKRRKELYGKWCDEDKRIQNLIQS